MSTAVVVGSGPNGLAAAVVLAEHGLDVTVLEAADEIGGGTRTSELTVPGVLHDHCSAVHPMGVASPAFRAMRLDEHGLEWCWPEVDLAHPVDGGRAGVLRRDLAATADSLGADGPRWRRLFGPITDGFDALNEDVLRSILHVPAHPIRLASFGTRALLPATAVARRWHTEEARGLFAGAAAHAFRPLTSVASASVGMALLGSAHAVGWPVARGGTAAINRALASKITSHGGKITTGVRVSSLAEVGGADVVLLDVSPRAAAEIVGDRLPARIRRAYERYRYGPASFKVDLAVQGGIPWTNESVRAAGTVHIGGRLEEIAAAEADVSRGRMPERPFVLLAQQYLADPSRSAGDIHPIWAYAHVPHGYDGDATEAVLAQIERFAPGTRDRIVAMATRSPAEFAAYNPNFVGGDIACGENDLRQILLRPRIAIDPYRTGVPGVYLCSAATPPGAGIHGMSGWNAAHAALRRL